MDGYFTVDISPAVLVSVFLWVQPEFTLACLLWGRILMGVRSFPASVDLM